jgi:hypothetical protein
MAGNPIAWLLCFAGFLHLSLRTVVLLSITVAHRWREPLSHLLGARRGLGFSSTRPCWQSQADSEAADAGATGGGGAAGSGGEGNGGGSSAGGDTCGDGECTQPASLSHGVGASSASEHVARNRYGWLLLAGHLIAWLPFAWVTRVAFLYHYIRTHHLPSSTPRTSPNLHSFTLNPNARLRPNVHRDYRPHCCCCCACACHVYVSRIACVQRPFC